MTGISITILQKNGVSTTFATIVDIRWQPTRSADVQIGYFLDQATYLAGGTPVTKEYFALDISLIDPAQAIPPQLIAQLTAVDAPLHGGTPT